MLIGENCNENKKSIAMSWRSGDFVFYGCESKDNNGISSADSSGSVITTAVQNTVPTAKLPDYSESSYTRPSYGNYAFTRKRESLRIDRDKYFRDILIEDGMDEDSVDDIMKKLEKSKEESTRTTLSQEEMRKKYLGE